MEKLSFEERLTNILKNECLPDIVRLTHNCDNPNWFYNFHRHSNHCEVVYVIDGCGTYIHDTETYKLKKGDIVLRNCGVIHCESSDPAHPLDAWALTLTNVEIEGLEPNFLIPAYTAPIIQAGVYDSLLKDAFERMYAIRTNMFPNSKYICQHLTCEILAYIYNLVPTTVFMEGEKPLSLIAEIKQYIDNHYKERITLQGLADVFHVSPSYISHKMVEVTGMSPINYLIKRRIGEAQLLMVSTDQSFSQIARCVGYENIDHFNKLFLKCTGNHPREFREYYSKRPSTIGYWRLK